MLSTVWNNLSTVVFFILEDAQPTVILSTDKGKFVVFILVDGKFLGGLFFEGANS